jgi:hypothetical protein
MPKTTRAAPPKAPAKPSFTHTKPTGKPSATPEPIVHREPNPRVAPAHGK